MRKPLIPVKDKQFIKAKSLIDRDDRIEVIPMTFDGNGCHRKYIIICLLLLNSSWSTTDLYTLWDSGTSLRRDFPKDGPRNSKFSLIWPPTLNILP